MEYKFCFCLDNKKKYVLDWYEVPNTWPVKIGSNLSRQEVLALKDAGCQLQEREAILPHYKLSTIAMLPIPQMDFCVLLNSNAHLTSKFGKTMRHNLSPLTTKHITNGKTLDS